MKKIFLLATFLFVFVAGACAQNKLTWKQNGMKCTVYLQTNDFSISLYDKNNNEYTFFIPEYGFEINASFGSYIYYSGGKIASIGENHINYVGEKVTSVAGTYIYYEDGRVSAIGNTPISYRGGKVTAIGKTYIKYNEGRVSTIGKASIYYSGGKVTYISGSVE